MVYVEDVKKTKRISTLMSKSRTFYSMLKSDKQIALDRLLLEWRKWRYGNKKMDMNFSEEFFENYVLVADVLAPFLLDSNSKYIQRHQGMWKPVELVKSFNNLGFNADIIGTGSDLEMPNPNKYSVLFGSRSHFFEAAQILPSSVTKIFYSTGMHWKFQNKQLEQRLQKLEERRGTRPTNTRKVTEGADIDRADYILMMGDEYTKHSYKSNCTIDDGRIYPITNAGFDELSIDPEMIRENKREGCQNNFLWFAGGGPVLKGLDLALEVFKDLKDLDLYVCGNLYNNKEFTEIYEEELYNTRNIHTLGWIDIHSDKFKKLTRNCGFHLSPSCSDGISGAVINTMHQGVVPIVTEATGIDTGDFGYVIDGTLESVQNAVTDARSLSEEDYINRSKNATQMALNRYSKEQYIQDIDKSIQSILDSEN